MLSLLFLVTLDLCLCPKEGSLMFAGAPWLSGPEVALVDDVIAFQCGVTSQPSEELILLQLFKQDDRTRVLAEYTSMNREPAVFPILVSVSHEGDLECVARVQNNSKIQPTVSSTHHLKVIGVGGGAGITTPTTPWNVLVSWMATIQANIHPHLSKATVYLLQPEPVRGAEVVVLSGPVDMFEGTELKLKCNVSAGNHLVYMWLLNERIITPSPLRCPSHDRLSIYRTDSEDSGSYACLASNQFNETKVFTNRSSAVVITVKELVSNPDIDFAVFKNDASNYVAEVSCRSDRGTPPITFSLYNRTRLVGNVTVDERNATFTAPVILGRHSGWFRCCATNGGRVASSRWLALEVVPVSGPVAARSEYNVGENFAVIGLRLYCKAETGSHPRYQWFLNGTVLQGRGSFFWVVDRPPHGSVLVLSVGGSTAGTYQCKVSDSFDAAAVFSGPKWSLDKEGLNRLPAPLVGVVFGCFAFLVSLVSLCCWIPVVFGRRRRGPKAALDMKMDNMTSTEDELDVWDFAEDVDLLTAATADQGSEASGDEEEP